MPRHCSSAGALWTTKLRRPRGQFFSLAQVQGRFSTSSYSSNATVVCHNPSPWTLHARLSQGAASVAPVLQRLPYQCTAPVPRLAPSLRHRKAAGGTPMTRFCVSVASTRLCNSYLCSMVGRDQRTAGGTPSEGLCARSGDDSTLFGLEAGIRCRFPCCALGISLVSPLAFRQRREGAAMIQGGFGRLDRATRLCTHAISGCSFSGAPET